MINTKYSLTFISEGAGGGGGGNFLSRKREGFLERGVNRGFTVRKTHLSVDFIIFEAFLEKKKKNMFISCNRAEKQTNVLKKCYVEAMLVKSLKTIMDE